MCRICFITTGDIRINAAAKRALGLANPLLELGWEVFIILEDTKENHSRSHLECDPSINLLFFSSCNVLQECKVKSEMVRRIRPDVVFFCALTFRNIIRTPRKTIKIVEHSELYSKIYSLSVVKRWQNYILEWYSIKYGNGLVLASKYLLNYFDSMTKKPLLYLPYAYNESICTHFDKEDSLPISKQANERFFVFLGNLTESYGAMTMCEAFEKISKQTSNLKLLLLGRGLLYERVCEYIKMNNLENVIYAPGYVPEEDIPRYFSLADAFLSPMQDTIQDWARCPSKLYMYLPYKKPIVTCKIGEPWEVLKEKGIYYEPFNAAKLSQILLQMEINHQWTLDINPMEHEWKARAVVLNNWLKNYKR